MRIIDCLQGSEEWESWRKRPTASNFYRIVTPVRGDLSAQAMDYACEIIAKENNAHDEGPPTYWMDRGNEVEPEAIAKYEAMNEVTVERVGFVVPDETELFGCSPDGLVGEDGLIEVKCPKAENLLQYKCGRKLPNEHRPQVQGQLMITGRKWCDVFIYHPCFEPFTIRVWTDLEYQQKLLTGIDKFLVILNEVRAAAKPVPGYVPPVRANKTDLNWSQT